MELRIKEEFKNLLPALSKSEFSRLENSILNEGCRDEIITWKGYIIDGHNRYEICKKHNINFIPFEADNFETEADVRLWMINNQFGKRNLNTYQKAKLAVEIEKLEKIKAKERQGIRNDLIKNHIVPDLVQCEDNSETLEINQSNIIPYTRGAEESGRSLKIAAKSVGIGYETARKTKKILESDNKDLIERLEKEEISINGAFQHIDRNRKRLQNNTVEKDVVISTKTLRTMRAEDMQRLFTSYFLKKFILNKKLEYVLICKDKGKSIKNKFYSDSNISFDESCKLYEKYASSKRQEKSHAKGKKIHLD